MAIEYLDTRTSIWYRVQPHVAALCSFWADNGFGELFVFVDKEYTFDLWEYEPVLTTHEKQQQKIADLERQLAEVFAMSATEVVARFPAVFEYCEDMEKQLAEANAKLAALEKQEPIGVVKEDDNGFPWKRIGYTCETDLARMNIGAPVYARPIPADTKDKEDAERLDWLASEYVKVDPFEIPTGGDDSDVGWRLSQYHMGKPSERVLAEHYKDDLREAIDAARKEVK